MRTIFVEDNASHRSTIRQLLEQYPGVILVGEADSVQTAFNMIRDLKPELVMLDVELYPGTAFDLLKSIQEQGQIDFEVIFLTGFANFEYPLRAIHYAALDFLMKPIDKDKFEEAIERAKLKIAEKKNPDGLKAQIEILLQNLRHPPEKRTNKVAFHRIGGVIEFVGTEEIVYCEADRDMTHVFLADGRKFTATRNLAFYARPLEIDFNFFRISDKQLVNLDFLRAYEHSKDYQLTLNNGVVLYASRRGGQELKQHFAAYYDAGSRMPDNPEKSDEAGILKQLLQKLFR